MTRDIISLMAPPKGFKHSADARAKMSRSRTGLTYSDAHRAAISRGLKGKPKSLAHRLALHVPRTLTDEQREASRRRFEKARLIAMSPNVRAKASATFSRTYRHSPDTRSKMSSIRRATPPTEAQRRAWRAVGLSAKGRKRTPEQNAAQSKLIRAQWANGERKVAKRFRYTSIAKTLHKYLTDLGMRLEPEVSFWPYTVDLYDPKHHIAIEADGQFWHDKLERERPGYSANRDSALKAKYGLTVIHYTDKEINQMIRDCSHDL